MRSGPGGSAIVRRSVQVTCSAAVGFYVFLYGLHEPLAALYALFAPIALGLLSSIPGTGRQQACVTLRTLPFGLALVALGTALAQSTAAAVAGMLVVGFLLTFSVVAGPRAAGPAPGLQLLYILACFPPYAPQTLGGRLTGVAVGVVLLALCQTYLLRGPPDRTFRDLLADALETAAVAAAEPDRVPVARLRALSEGMRLSRVAPGERPTGPGRGDRALGQAGGAARRILDQLASQSELSASEGVPLGTDPASAVLRARVADICADLAGALRTGRPPPSADLLRKEIERFQAARIRRAADPGEQDVDSRVLRRQAAVLTLAESAWIVVTAVGVAAAGHRGPPLSPRDLFWYVDLSTASLWTRRIVGNATHRSVWFQNAVRVACGLAVARLVAGTLDLAHGFWVLLTVLTLARTTVGATWRAVREAVLGNLVGAVAAGALLIAVGRHLDAYAVLLVPGMLIAFDLGPRLGVAYAQGLFTLVVALAFAQIAPTTWRLSEARLVDVVTGSVIGLLCGLLAWPAGARREVRRTMASLLRSCGALVPATVDALLEAPGADPCAPSTSRTLHHLRLAEAAYAQFRSEPPTAREDVQADWHGVLVVAYHTVLGAQRLPCFEVPTTDVPPDARAWARRTAAELTTDVDRIALRFTTEQTPAPGRRPCAPPLPRHHPGLPTLVDLEVWLTAMDHQLRRIETSLTAKPGSREAVKP
ncbi:FUSC family protein [Streptomyces sp. NPDC059466]|uniref:FUSC family protein n=1 Tax=unclassified Streptomyces TaxID=2593676 RepID=UPI0036A696F6